MDPTQFERIKTELKRERYGSLKTEDLDVKIGNFQGWTAKRQGHIHNYVYKPEGHLASGPRRIYVWKGVFLGGFKEECQDTETDLEITGNPKGLNAKQPRASSSSGQMRMAARVASFAGDSST
jgi:hypothetical protein